jgi:hypothetical protein
VVSGGLSFMKAGVDKLCVGYSLAKTNLVVITIGLY